MRLKKVVLVQQDSDVIEWWSSTITQVLSRIQKKPRHLLVFINPYGGKGRGKQLWENKISEIFKTAGITCKVFNGVLLRAAHDAKVESDDKDAKFVPPDMMVGFIPGGSTDTVAMCLHGSTDPVTAALHIVLGDKINVDVVSIHSKDRLERFAMTMLSYGYFGDLMKHSERLRWLGKLRYDVSGVRTFLAHNNYKGTIRYTPSETDSMSLLTDKCGDGCPTCNADDDEKAAAVDDKEQDAKEKAATTRSNRDKCTVEKEISGKFLAVTSATLSCSCRHTVPGMSPGAHTGDGSTDLIIVHKTSYLNYFRYLFRTAFHTEHPFTLPFVQAVRVKQWTFMPQGADEKHSSWNCDGEI